MQIHAIRLTHQLFSTNSFDCFDWLSEIKRLVFFLGSITADFYLTDLCGNSEKEIDEPNPIPSLTRIDGRKPALLLRFRSVLFISFQLIRILASPQFAKIYFLKKSFLNILHSYWINVLFFTIVFY